MENSRTWLSLDELESTLDDLVVSQKLLSRGWSKEPKIVDKCGRHLTCDSADAIEFSITTAMMAATVAPSVRFYRLLDFVNDELKVKGYRAVVQFERSKDCSAKKVTSLMYDVAIRIQDTFEKVFKKQQEQEKEKNDKKNI